MEPTTLLSLNYKTLFELTKEHDTLRQNLSRLIAEAVNSTLMGERRKKLPRVISFFHQTPATRPLAPIARTLARFRGTAICHTRQTGLAADGGHSSFLHDSEWSRCFR